MDIASGEGQQPGLPLLESRTPKFKFSVDGAQTPTKHILSILELNASRYHSASRLLMVQPISPSTIPASRWNVSVVLLNGRDALASYQVPASDWDR